MMNSLHPLLSRVINFFNYCQDPYLVSRFQNFFGVYRIDSNTNGNLKYNSSKDKQANQSPKSNCKILTIKYDFMDCENIFRHRKTLSSGSENSKTSPVTSDGEEMSSDGDSDFEYSVKCRIENSFWYFFFSFGAGLGYEMFYASFFPFWIWNIDGAVCRRVINVWVLIMYVGQAMKDIICWPRPAAPPVIHLEPQYVIEYGMPSTHAMVGAAVPFSILYFTMFRYEYRVIIGILLAIFWCVLVCCSRLYMGMHTVLDIIGGLCLVAVLMVIILPFSDYIDHFQLTNKFSPLITIAFMLFLQVTYPKTTRWTPARGDTAVIMGTGTGFALGSWLNYSLGVIRGPPIPPPYSILWPGYKVFGLALLRAMIGISCIIATRAFFNSITYGLLCYVMRVDPRDLKSRQKLLVEIPSKFLTYTAIGFVITYVSPFVFRLLNIERLTMFTEV
ncbi:sphingosine-1-phosphate phosphatase 2 [Parasteatoda tepidariorum]|uniref:sphingosine-1-phosphate phosphatase 2 n=1 Tax=Parasteatoda tepidariorum TaxID=114398 RepID=UPI001C7227DE|nr:sphingosine-1-phosphate phosphatase 2 [Parasteatoda tepidariorum]